MHQTYQKTILGLFFGVLFVTLLSCSSSETPEEKILRIVKERAEHSKRGLELLESIDDKASLKSARSEILSSMEQDYELLDELNEAQLEYDATGPNDEAKEALEEKIREIKEDIDSDSDGTGFKRSMRRISSIPGAEEFFRKLSKDMRKIQKRHWKRMSNRKAPSNTPSLEELDQQLIAVFQKLENTLEGVRKPSDISEATKKIAQHSAELKKIVNYLSVHNQCSTITRNSSEATQSVKQLEAIGKRVRQQAKRIKAIKGGRRLFAKLRDTHTYLTKKAKQANGSLNRKYVHQSDLQVKDFNLWYAAYKRAYQKGAGLPEELPPTSWDDLVAKLKRRSASYLESDFGDMIDLFSERGYVVRWGHPVKSGGVMTSVPESLEWSALIYGEAVPYRGGLIGTQGHALSMVSPAGLRLVLANTFLTEMIHVKGPAPKKVPQKTDPLVDDFGDPIDSRPKRSKTTSSARQLPGGFNHHMRNPGMRGNPGIGPPGMGNPGTGNHGQMGHQVTSDTKKMHDEAMRDIEKLNKRIQKHHFPDGPGSGPIMLANPGGISSPSSPFRKKKSTKTAAEWTNALDSENTLVLEEAFSNLNKVDPSTVSNETRIKIAQKAQKIAFDSSGFSDTRAAATKGLVVWGGKFSVPLLVQLIEKPHEREAVQDAALKGLKKLGSPKGAEAASKLLKIGRLKYDVVVDYLESVGPSAEEYVLKNAQPDTSKVTRKTVQLLGKIGTIKSFKAFKALEKSIYYRAIQSDIEEAKRAIRARKNQEKKDD